MGRLRALALLTGAVYLVWRLAFTHDGAHPVLFVALLAAEAFGYLRTFVEPSMYGRPRPATRTPATAPAPDADVVVVVADEPASEVRAAVLAARLVHGSRSLLVVDRDDRPDVAELCQRLGLERVAGAADADLGELLDTAFDRSQSLFTLLVPADVVVMPDVLEVTADAFTDGDVAVVHCRVERTNAVGPLDHGGYGEDRRRDELMRPTLDEAGVLPWWPGMAVIRRSALRDIDGMSRGRDGVTLATGLRLQAAGWRITDVPVVVGRRLAPWTDDRHLHEWARDLHERLAVLTDRTAPLRHAHSTRLSRRIYRTADLHLGRSIQRLVLIAVLFAVLFGPSLPLVANPAVLTLLWGAWMGSSLAYRRAAETPLCLGPWMVGDLRLLATDLVVSLRALPGKPLGIDLADPAPGRLLRSVVLWGLHLGLGFGLAVYGTGVARPSHGDFATLAALVIAGWMLAMSFRARAGLQGRQHRQNFRAADHLPVLGGADRIRIVGISPFGLDVVSARQIRPAQKFRITFGLPQTDGPDVTLEVPVAARRVSQDGRYHLAYLRFAHLPDADVDRITEYCAVTAGHRALRGPLEEVHDATPLAATLVEAE